MELCEMIPNHFRAGDHFGSSWGSFRGWDHFKARIISGLGIISGPVGDHFRAGIISGLGSFQGQDHFKASWGSFRGQDHVWAGIISGPVQYAEIT